MIAHRFGVSGLILMTALLVWPCSASAQNVIGDALGQLITPAVGAVPRPMISPNVSVNDIALTHVVSSGPQFGADVIRREATKIAELLDSAALRFLQNPASGDSAHLLRNDYRALLATARPQNARAVLLMSHKNTLAEAGQRRSISAIMKAADSAERVAGHAADGDGESLVATIDSLRDHLTRIRGPVVTGTDLAVMAERVKNLRNAAVMMEIARVLGMQRSDAIFSRLADAARKSRAPRELTTGLIGVAIGSEADTPASMRLPEGIPSVVLYNPPNNPSDIRFVCDDSLHLTLAPGELVPLDQPFVVAFDKGDGTVMRYRIHDGLFRWIVDRSGHWGLRKKETAEWTIDATDSPAAFHYLFNGRPHIAEPGSVFTHPLTGPSRVDFDRGFGDGSVKSTLVTPGHFVVGVNGATGGWDLIRQHDAPNGMNPSGSATTVGERAMKLLRESIGEVTNLTPIDPAEAKVDALLDSLE